MTATTLPGVLLSGTHASRPAASAVASGALYAETDTGQIYQSDGASTWTAWGAVAIANPLTTKGDLIVGGAAGVLSRLGVGADGYVVTADSAQALGVKWAASGGASGQIGTLIQSKAIATSANAAVTLDATPTVGDILVAVCGTSGNGGAGGVSAITQTNVAWTKIANSVSGNVNTTVWVGVISASPGTVVTLTAPQFSWLYVTEWSGLAGTIVGSAVARSSSILTGVLTPTDPCVIFAGWGCSSGGANGVVYGANDWGVNGNFGGAGWRHSDPALNQAIWIGVNAGQTIIAGVK